MSANDHLHVSVVTPEGAAYEGPAASVVAPAFDGEVAFFKDHAPFVGMLGEGELRVTPVSGSVERFFLTGGVVQVRDNSVSILAELVAAAESIDVAAAQKELETIQGRDAVGEEALSEREAQARVARARIRVGGGSAGH